MNEAEKKDLYSLVTLEDFKTIMGIDDRDDKLSRFCLVTATKNIEQYCCRILLDKKYIETIKLYGELCLTLNEFPISEILAVYTYGIGQLLEPDYYRTYPDINDFENVHHSLYLSPAVLKMGCNAVMIIYYAGYKKDNIPADLAAACLELAVWYFLRYKSRRVGLTGSARKDGEIFEITMPENVKALLEPYRRKTI